MAVLTCADCGGTVSTSASACPHCGAPTSAQSSAAGAAKPKKKPSSTRSIGGGFVFLIIGVAIYFWAQQHNPNLGLGEAIMSIGSDRWVLKPEFYNKALVAAAVSGIGGLLSVIQGFILQAKSRD